MGKAEPLLRLGAKPAGTAAELATRDIVFITVGSSDDLISAVLGPGGLMSGHVARPPPSLVTLAGHNRLHPRDWSPGNTFVNAACPICYQSPTKSLPWTPRRPAARQTNPAGPLRSVAANEAAARSGVACPRQGAAAQGPPVLTYTDEW